MDTLIPLFNGAPKYSITSIEGEEEYCLGFGRDNPEILKLLKGKYRAKSKEEAYAQFLKVKQGLFPKAKGKWSVLFEFYQK